MRRYPKLRVLIAIFFLMVALPALAQVGGEPKDLQYTPEVPIPGVFDQTVTVDRLFLANYIKSVYTYFMWVVGILATFMVIFGGLKWVAAAGNPSRINDAREIINSAIIGVIIALTSVVLLNLIDPRYTRFGLPDLTPVPANSLDILDNLKNPDGSCKATSEIPCGVGCTDPTKGTVYGDCAYCDSSQVDRDTNHCGFDKLDPLDLHKNGNCLYTACQESDEVCIKIESQFTVNHTCSAQSKLRSLEQAEFGDLPQHYSGKYACGTIWWEKAFMFYPEKINIGRDCTGNKHCVVDYSQHISVAVRKSEIPNDESKFQIGQFQNAGCH